MRIVVLFTGCFHHQPYLPTTDMATSNTDFVDNNYCCDVCKDDYNDPRVLSCLHSFSLKCLKELISESTSAITCPTCGHQTTIPPDKDVESLRFNVRLNCREACKQIVSRISNVPAYCTSCGGNVPQAVCMDCEDFLCEQCWTAHQQLKKSRTHYSFTVEEAQEMTPYQLLKTLPVSYTSPAPLCQKHEGQKVDLYCQQCSLLVCLKCSIVDHKGHQMHEVKKYASLCKRTLGQALESISNAHNTLSELSISISVTLDRIDTRRKELDSSIKQSFAQLFQLLKQREELLSSRVNDVADSKEVVLSAQLDDIQKMLQPFTDFCSIGSTVMSGYTDFELLSIASTIEERANDIQKKFKETPLELCESSNIPSEVNNDSLSNMIKRYGHVSITSPSNSTAVMPRCSIAHGAEMTVAVIARDNKKQQVNDPGSEVNGSLISPNMEKIDCPVSDNGDGTYSINIKPIHSGIHKLSITIHSQHINGSPFDITVAQRRNYTKIEKPLKKITGIEYPRCIAFAPNGDMFVTSDNHCVYIYDTNGKKKNTIGSQGGGQLQFESPHGIAINRNEVYVAEYGGDRIHKFTTDGKFLSTFGEHGLEVGKFNNPHDVKVSPFGKIFVADTDNCRIQVFNSDWSIVQVIDGRNLDKNSFKAPMGLAFDLQGNLLVTEHERHSLAVLSLSGQFLRKYNDPHLTYPVSIAVDAAGFVIVVNYNPGSLAIFDNNGNFVHSIKGFNYPLGVTMSSEGCIWVADYYNKRLLKY